MYVLKEVCLSFAPTRGGGFANAGAEVGAAAFCGEQGADRLGGGKDSREGLQWWRPSSRPSPGRWSPVLWLWLWGSSWRAPGLTQSDLQREAPSLSQAPELEGHTLLHRNF